MGDRTWAATWTGATAWLNAVGLDPMPGRDGQGLRRSRFRPAGRPDGPVLPERVPGRPVESGYWPGTLSAPDKAFR